jgi:hypothetical protein
LSPDQFSMIMRELDELIDEGTGVTNGSRGGAMPRAVVEASGVGVSECFRPPGLCTLCR